MNFFAKPYYACSGISLFLFLCIYCSILTPHSFISYYMYFFGKVRIPKRMGFVAFGLRPLTIYFTLIFELLLENYMAECRHFRCELSLW